MQSGDEIVFIVFVEREAHAMLLDFATENPTTLHHPWVNRQDVIADSSRCDEVTELGCGLDGHVDFLGVILTKIPYLVG